MNKPSKYNLLEAELVKMEEEVARRRRELDGLESTPCGYPCSACGTVLETELDFAQHFVVAQIDRMNRHFNLGECPNTERGRNIIANFN